MARSPLAFLLLSACAFAAACSVNSPSRRAGDHGLSLPGGWTAASLDSRPLHDQWWRDFGDAELDALVLEALKHNPNLEAAASRLAAAEAQARSSGADLWPRASAGFTASRRQSVIESSSSPFAPAGGPLQFRSNAHGVSLDVSWEIDIWGRARAQAGAAIADFEAEAAAFEGARLSLIAQVCKARFELTALTAQVGIARTAHGAAASLEDRVRDRYGRGLVNAQDLKLSESLTHGMAARLSQAERLQDAIRRQLDTLLGKYPDGTSESASTLPEPPADPPIGLPASLLSRRPDLVAAERRWAAARGRTENAEASRLPRIALTASAGTTSGEFKNLVNGDFSVWALAANITAPIFEAGRLKADAEAALSREEALRYTYIGAALAAFAEVETVLAADKYLAEQLAAIEKQAAASKDGFELATRRYADGLADILPVLKSGLDYYNSLGEAVSVRLERLQSRINLYVALGGGFDATTILTASERTDRSVPVASSGLAPAE